MDGREASSVASWVPGAGGIVWIALEEEPPAVPSDAESDPVNESIWFDVCRLEVAQ